MCGYKNKALVLDSWSERENERMSIKTTIDPPSSIFSFILRVRKLLHEDPGYLEGWVIDARSDDRAPATASSC